MTTLTKTGTPAQVRTRRLLIVGLAGLLMGLVAFSILNAMTQPRRTTPVYDPPVLAGQQLWGYCSGGFYARRRDTIVLTSTGHCASEGTVAYDPDGMTVRGVFGPAAGMPHARIRGTRARRPTSITWSSPGTAFRGVT